MTPNDLQQLISILERIPAIKGKIGSGLYQEGFWWVKLSIDINHPLAWRTVQELGYILNYLSVEERLPTMFYPVSPPPYLNGGPTQFLSWIIENTDSSFLPTDVLSWLLARLPSPIEDLESWEER